MRPVVLSISLLTALPALAEPVAGGACSLQAPARMTLVELPTTLRRLSTRPDLLARLERVSLAPVRPRRTCAASAAPGATISCQEVTG